MRLLALDLSLTGSGWATSLDEYGTHSTTTKGVERLHELYLWLMDLTWSDTRDDLGVDLALIEGYAYGKGNQAHQVGEWGGVARFTLYRIGLPFVEVPPAVLKKFATGKGNAPKPDMRMELYKRSGLDVADDNAVDALWLLALGRELVGDPLWDMPKANREVLAKVELPEGVT